MFIIVSWWHLCVYLLPLFLFITVSEMKKSISHWDNRFEILQTITLKTNKQKPNNTWIRIPAKHMQTLRPLGICWVHAMFLIWAGEQSSNLVLMDILCTCFMSQSIPSQASVFQDYFLSHIFSCHIDIFIAY